MNVASKKTGGLPRNMCKLGGMGRGVMVLYSETVQRKKNKANHIV